MPVPVGRRLRANKAPELTTVPASGNVANFHAFHAIVVGATVIGGSSARAFGGLLAAVFVVHPGVGVRGGSGVV